MRIGIPLVGLVKTVGRGGVVCHFVGGLAQVHPGRGEIGLQVKGLAIGLGGLRIGLGQHPDIAQGKFNHVVGALFSQAVGFQLEPGRLYTFLFYQRLCMVEDPAHRQR